MQKGPRSNKETGLVVDHTVVQKEDQALEKEVGFLELKEKNPMTAPKKVGIQPRIPSCGFLTYVDLTVEERLNQKGMHLFFQHRTLVFHFFPFFQDPQLFRKGEPFSFVRVRFLKGAEKEGEIP